MSRDEDRPSRRTRKLNDEERQLWRSVAHSVTPLRRRVSMGLPHEPEATPAMTKATPRAGTAAPHSASRPLPAYTPPRQQKPSIPPLEPMARREKTRVARGRAAIDARIDLHGRTQAEAYDALMGFIRRAQARGARTVLVVTGKGKGGEGSDGERGVLRRQVPMWLAAPELRGLVIGFDAAAIGHGGEGALYVRLRRDRGLADE